MFETAELGRKVDKAKYRRELPRLRQALLDAQRELRDAGFPVIIVIGGVDGAGKGETVNTLLEWMDPRFIETVALGEPNCEETARPPFWRYWRNLPPKGKIGILFGAWHTAPIVDRTYGRISMREMDRALDRTVDFEKMLVAEGALILKFWMHLSKKEQAKRLRKLEQDKTTRWRVTRDDWKHFERYDDFRATSERALRKTSSAEAPWIVVEGTDRRYQTLTVGKSILQNLRRRLDAPQGNGKGTATVHPAPLHEQVSVLDHLDMTQTLSDQDYGQALSEYQGRLDALVRKAARKGVGIVCAFEGSDAAGKGGTIRRITSALDARMYRIIPVAAPTAEERLYPYLWRFWRHVPPAGRLAIFDRTWYGRVLVERVEGFCGEADWRRAYHEINDFEDQLAGNGFVLCKFWLQITKDEQLRRFKDRQATDFKRFKITEEDWRNRKKWDRYEQAVSEMVEKTSTEIAPWTLVEANSKNFARIKVLRTVCERLDRAL